MVETTEIVTEEAQNQAFLNVLKSIRDQSQKHFEFPLHVEWVDYGYDTQSSLPSRKPYFLIVEIRMEKWLVIFSKKKRRRVLFVSDRFHNSSLSTPGDTGIISCTVYFSSILEIVKKEIQNYADFYKVARLEITKNFS